MFQPGNQLASGGARPGSGRPSRAEVQGLQKAKERLERYLAKNMAKIGRTYVGLAAGQVIETERGEIKLEVDPPTTRHAIERLIPPARQEVELTITGFRVVTFDPDGDPGQDGPQSAALPSSGHDLDENKPKRKRR